MWRLHGIQPEALDCAKMQVRSPGYPLRPEIVESAYYLYHCTGDMRYRGMGKEFSGISCAIPVPGTDLPR